MSLPHCHHILYRCQSPGLLREFRTASDECARPGNEAIVYQYIQVNLRQRVFRATLAQSQARLMFVTTLEMDMECQYLVTEMFVWWEAPISTRVEQRYSSMTSGGHAVCDDSLNSTDHIWMQRVGESNSSGENSLRSSHSHSSSRHAQN